MHNQAPKAVLKLTNEQAQVLLASCASNIAVGLSGLSFSKDPATLKALVRSMEVFKVIRAKLIEQGVEEITL